MNGFLNSGAGKMQVPVTVLVSEDLSSRIGREEEHQEKQRTAQDKNAVSRRCFTVRARPLVRIPPYLSSPCLPIAKAGQ